MNPHTNPNWAQNNLTPDGNFEVINGAKVILHSGDVVNGGGIGLFPGTNVFPGGEMDVFIDHYPCGPDPAWRLSGHNGAVRSGSNANTTHNQGLQLASASVNAQQSNGIRVYPNPNTGQLTIERESEEKAEVSIGDVEGKIVFKSTLTGNGAKTFDLSLLQNGMYLLQVGTDKFKLMIVK